MKFIESCKHKRLSFGVHFYCAGKLRKFVSYQQKISFSYDLGKVMTMSQNQQNILQL